MLLDYFHRNKYSHSKSKKDLAKDNPPGLDPALREVTGE
jgi:hypothetical protein